MSQDCKQTEHEILERLNGMYAAYSRQDLDAVLAFFAPDPDVVVIGTAEDERVMGIESIRDSWKRSVDEPLDLNISITWHSVTCRGDIAWFSVELLYAVNLDQEATVNIVTRATGVMERRGQEQQLLICQYHASHATPRLFASYASNARHLLSGD